MHVSLTAAHDTAPASCTQRDANPGLRKRGILLAAFTGGAALAISVVCVPFVSPALRRVCLPYVPATPAQLRNVLAALQGRSGRLIDLGSGDGRVVVLAAKAGFKADGVELNPWLVLYSRVCALRLGVGRTTFHRQDLWTFHLAPYNNVVVFGVQEMMPDLGDKLSRELRPDACVVACRFPFPGRNPDTTFGTGVDTVWLYRQWQVTKH